MKSIDVNSQIQIDIKKSKFIAYSFYVEDEQSVIKHLDLLKKEYGDATHICYAYVLNSPNREKAFDDGEPDGTAGKPILEVIKKQKLSNVLIIVVRYFGGIKLGSGGLARAYLNSASEVVKQSKICEYDYAYYYKSNVAIADAKSFIASINSQGAVVTHIEYGQQVVIDYYSFVKLGDDYIDCKLTKKV